MASALVNANQIKLQNSTLLHNGIRQINFWLGKDPTKQEWPSFDQIRKEKIEKNGRVDSNTTDKMNPAQKHFLRQCRGPEFCSLTVSICAFVGIEL